MPRTGIQPLLQVDRRRTVFHGTARDLHRLREEFDRRHSLVLPAFLAPDVLKIIQVKLKDATFFTAEHRETNTERLRAGELRMTPNSTLGALTLLCNDPVLIEYMQQISGFGRIADFVGRIYRFLPGSTHFWPWHDDDFEHRVIALSVNLSTGKYDGGRTQIRERGTKRIVGDLANTGYGDALMFRIAPYLQHRVAGVVGTVPKTTFAGWFRSQSESDPPWALR